MKFIIIIFFSFSVSSLISQTVEYGIFEVSEGNYEVRMKAVGGNYSGAFIGSAQIGLRAENGTVISNIMNPVPKLSFASNGTVSGSINNIDDGFTYFPYFFQASAGNIPQITLNQDDELVIFQFQANLNAARNKSLTRGVEIQLVDNNSEFATSSGQSVNNAMNIGGNSSAYSGNFAPSSALPITLTVFTAEKASAKSILLNWTSELEINSSHFGIERSTDGENFIKIEEVAAAGNSTSEIDYDFLDRNITLQRSKDKIYYYRLKQVDLDGAYEYSEIRAVRMEGGAYADIAFYPNPTTELLHIDFSDEVEDNGQINLEIINTAGQQVMTRRLDISQQRLHLINLPEEGITNGVYLVRLRNNAEILSSQKVVLAK